MQRSEVRRQTSEKSLSILVLADVECAWCKKITGKKFINADNKYSQMQIKNSGRLISHGICKACSDDLFNNEGKIEETARELKPVMEMIEAAAFNPSPKSIEKYFNGMDSAIKSRNDIHI